ncbi:MAG: zinc-ribbon domain-containing protein [Segniliparus sp.]|uniref:zinc-ribbon domain-containing protein n=1 Tax=Segniliparus sp. TaxID=2804064 RepID=UPI003F3AFC95
MTCKPAPKTAPRARRRKPHARHCPQPGESLADLYPELAAEWHPTLNSPLTPRDVKSMSNKRAHWRCGSCGETWETTVVNRTLSNGPGCRKCSMQKAGRARRTPKSGESIAELRPDLAAEWHPTRNGVLTPHDVRPGSELPIWWRCSTNAHEWMSTAWSRSNGSRCPHCQLWNTSAEEIRLKCELSAAGVPFDLSNSVQIPSQARPLLCDMVCSGWKLILEFDGYRFHRTAESARRDSLKTNLLEDAGWTVVRIREELELIDEANDVRVAKGSSELARAKTVLRKLRQLGFEAPNHDAYMGSTTPKGALEANAALRRELSDSLAARDPELAAEWHPTLNGKLTPGDVKPRSGENIWWSCTICGHAWQARVVKRTGGRGCPPCARKRQGDLRRTPKPGGSLAELRPELAEQWHPTLNGELTPGNVKPGSTLLAYWQCPACKGVWQTAVNGRSAGKALGCRSCAQKQRRRGAVPKSD